MRIRPYTESDLDALRRMHASQDFDYPFPNLDDPIFVSKLVLEDDHGRPVMAALARLTCEMYLLVDRTDENQGRNSRDEGRNEKSTPGAPSFALFAKGDSGSVAARKTGPDGRRLVEPGGSAVPGNNACDEAAHSPGSSCSAGFQPAVSPFVEAPGFLALSAAEGSPANNAVPQAPSSVEAWGFSTTNTARAKRDSDAQPHPQHVAEFVATADPEFSGAAHDAALAPHPSPLTPTSREGNSRASATSQSPQRLARERWFQLLALHRAGELDLFERGLDDAHAWLPPQIARRFGRRLQSLGWLRDDSWTPYCKRLVP